MDNEMDIWLNTQDKKIADLYEAYYDINDKQIKDSYQKQYDDQEVQYDSDLFTAMENYMKRDDAKATLCEKAAKADPTVMESKKKLQGTWRNVCSAKERIKYCQNRYEAEKAKLRVVEEMVNKAGNYKGESHV